MAFSRVTVAWETRPGLTQATRDKAEAARRTDTELEGPADTRQT